MSIYAPDNGYAEGMVAVGFAREWLDKAKRANRVLFPMDYLSDEQIARLSSPVTVTKPDGSSYTYQPVHIKPEFTPEMLRLVTERFPGLNDYRIAEIFGVSYTRVNQARTRWNLLKGRARA